MIKRVCVIGVGVFVAVSALIGIAPAEVSELTENKKLVQRTFDDVWNKGNLEVLEDIFSPKFVRHFPIGPPMIGLDNLRERVVKHRAAFPDWTEDVVHMIAEGELVAVQFKSTGTNEGSFLGNPPTGKRISIFEMSIFRIEDGKIIEQWILPDLLGLHKQLGFVVENSSSK